MKVGVPREIMAGETRVALVPDTVRRLVAQGVEVLVEAEAGAGAFLADDAYAQAGAKVAPDAAAVWSEADVIVKVHPPTEGEVELLREDALLVAMLAPVANAQLAEALARRKVTSFSLDAIPRITRAQSMDVLSSMSTLAGYKAVLLAAGTLGRIMPMLMTAAGTLQPANVLVIGAGVAGLQAIATARRLGAVVTGVDTRPAVQEQVESLGAKFVPLEVSHDQAEEAGGYATDLGEEFYRGEQEILASHVASADAVITAALVPGRRAPLLITEAMVASMAGGSVIVDLAAVAGGNCALTQPGDEVRAHRVTVIGPLNLPASLPVNASAMYSRNVAAFLGELIEDGQVRIDMDNDILRETLITRDGSVVHERTRAALSRGKEQS